jgi:hypothetical protein
MAVEDNRPKPPEPSVIATTGATQAGAPALTPPPAPAQQPLPNNSDSHKESAKLAIELTKQFITLAVGAIGFVIGLLSSNLDLMPKTVSVACLIGFAASVVCGLFFFMCAVGEINLNSNFDVYHSRLRFFGAGQLFLFLLCVAMLGFFAVKRIYSPNPVSASMTATTNAASAILEVKIGSKEIRHPIFEKSKVSLVLSTNEQVSISVEPAR